MSQLTRCTKKHHFSDNTWPRCITWIESWENLRKPKMNNILWNNYEIIFKRVKVMKVKERWRNCSRLKETNSVYQLHTTCNSAFFFFFLSWPHRTSCGLLVPPPGIEPTPPALEAQSLNHWTTREAPQHVILNQIL